MTFDSYDITTSTANATSEVQSPSITATQNSISFDVLQCQMCHIVHPDTTVTANIRTTTENLLHVIETPFQLDSASDAKSIALNKNVYYTNPRLIASPINQTNEMSSTTNNKSMLLNVSMGYPQTICHLLLIQRD